MIDAVDSAKMQGVDADESMLNAPLPDQPDLVTTPDGIALVFPDQSERISSEHRAELRQAVVGFSFLFVFALGAFWFLAFHNDQLPPDFASHLVWIAIGGIGLLLLATASLVWRWKRLPISLKQRLDSLLLAIEIHNQTVRRIFASNRTEIWSREDIETIAVEQFQEGDSEGAWDVLRLMVERRHEPAIHLFGEVRDFADVRERQMLEWMAFHLRKALQVPYEHVPRPQNGFVRQMLPGGIEIQVPFDSPEQKWRKGVSEILTIMGSVAGCILFGVVVLQIDQRAKGQANAKMWADTGFLGIAILVVVATFGLMALGSVWNRRKEIAGFSDAVIVAVGIRGGTAFRRYHSGREETWPPADIERFVVETRNREPVDRLWMLRKDGAPLAFFGETSASQADTRRREGLQWMARELNAALAETRGEADVKDVAEAIREAANSAPAVAPTREAIRRLS